MPVVYGEGKNAVVHLQKEIMNLTDDLSLFDWVGEPSEFHSHFASHPSCFAVSSKFKVMQHLYFKMASSNCLKWSALNKYYIKADSAPRHMIPMHDKHTNAALM
jgi:hypothetical protein